MSKSILIIGESGSGKSSSIRTLDSKETYIINVIGKDLPFKGGNKDYKQEKGGNLFNCDDTGKILQCLMAVSKEREDIKTIIIDDFQYIMSNEFMRRTGEKGWEKYNDIASNAFSILDLSKKLRDDITVIIISHSDKDDEGFIRFKTVGKLIDRMVDVEGLFTIVLLSRVVDGKYWFKTNSDGESRCKSPFGLFDDKLIPNDLNYVLEKIRGY